MILTVTSGPVRERRRRTFSASLLLAAAAVAGMVFVLVLSVSPPAADAAESHEFTVLEQERVIHQANAVFDCLQSREDLRQHLRNLMVHRYQARDGYSASFAAIRADYMLRHRYFFLELNTMFTWRDLGDPLMGLLYRACAHTPA